MNIITILMNRRYIILLLTTFGGCYLYRNYLKGTEENTFTSIKEYPEPLNKFITGEHNSCFKAHRYQEGPK